MCSEPLPKIRFGEGGETTTTMPGERAMSRACESSYGRSGATRCVRELRVGGVPELFLFLSSRDGSGGTVGFVRWEVALLVGKVRRNSRGSSIRWSSLRAGIVMSF